MLGVFSHAIIVMSGIIFNVGGREGGNIFVWIFIDYPEQNSWKNKQTKNPFR